MALIVIHEIRHKKEWELLQLLRYDGQEKVNEHRTRVDLYDEAKQTKVMVYCLTRLVPDTSFWTKQNPLA
jgi:hypothetical protein